MCKEKKYKPIVALCYDFDKTLSPDDMQSQGFIQDIGFKDVSIFWDESNSLATDNLMDQNLAWMYEMKKHSEGKKLFTKDTLRKHGESLALFPGVERWFDRINEYGDMVGVKVEHYIISSGLKEIIEGTTIASKFKQIYASSFLFDKNDVGIWPAQVVNYTNKTQFLFRIEKGVLDISDESVNDYVPSDQLAVPYRNMIYIGDSATDIPCMEVVNSHGGYSIGVYNAKTKDKRKVYKMIRDNRIKFFAPADYSEDGELDHLVKAIIDRTAKNEWLEREYYSCLKEVNENDKGISEEKREKADLILELADSWSFRRTHSLIRKMNEINTWTSKEVDEIAKVALQNFQVRYVINDSEIKAFIKKITRDNTSNSCKELNSLLN